MDREFVLRALKRIADEEDDIILGELAELDSLFSKAQRLNCPSWRAERQRTVATGVKRAGARMMGEVRGLAGIDAPAFAEETGTLVARLANPLVLGNGAPRSPRSRC